MGVKKFVSTFVVVLMLISVMSVVSGNEETGNSIFFDGSGTEEDPYLIRNIYDLRNISVNSTEHYVLANDIDANETKDWNNGIGFLPIRNFMGTFDGQGHKISDIYIHRSSTNHIGLFSYMRYPAVLKNVRIENANVTGNTSVGSLLGSNVGGSVVNCSANGTVTGNNYAGGLVGTNLGLLKDSYTDGNVLGLGKEAGGLVGANNGTVKESYSTATVNGNMSVGGLAGWNRKIIEDSYAIGDVDGNEHVGGLVGRNYLNKSHIYDSYANGTVNGTEHIGALVGWNDRGNVWNSYASGMVTGWKNVSGFIGWNRGNLSGSHSNADVDGSINVGGVVGWNSRRLENSYATGDVSGEENIGGLVGTNNDTVLNSYAAGTVTGDICTGGLIGWNHMALVNNSYATGTVNGGTDVGGFVGCNSESEYGIKHSYSTGTVTGDSNVGGFGGTNQGTIYNCFWDFESSGIVYSDGGIGKKTSQMKDVETFTNTSSIGLKEPWDFVGNPHEDVRDENIWDIDGNDTINEGYPFLSWEVGTVLISPSEDQTITAGETVEFSAEAYHGSGVLVENETTMFTWENTTEEGMFEITEAGVYNVTATYDGAVSDTVTITVEPAAVSTVEISPSVDQVITAGETIDFDASAADTYGNTITDDDTAFTWDNTDEEGMFEETMVGDYEVSAEYGGVSSSVVTVTVETGEVSDVEISPSADQVITAGETIDFDALAMDTYGNTVTDDDTDFTWENAGEDGTFTMTSEGDYIVTASYEGMTSEPVNVTVETAAVSTVEISPSADQVITAGETIDFSAEAYDMYGNLLTDDDTDFTWENAGEDGNFTNTAAGEYDVTASYEGATSGSVTVTVGAAGVDTVEISPSEDQTITAGDSVDFSAEAYDMYGNLITDVDGDFTWDGTDTEGSFSLTEAGTHFVTASYGGVTSSPVTVDVEAAEVSNVMISPSEDQTITAGGSVDFSAEAHDIYDNLISDDDTDFTWENADTDGTFSMTNAGDYTVRAEYEGEGSNIVTVIVEVASVSTVEVSPSGDQELPAGEIMTFNAWANDSYGNIITDDDVDFTWENTDQEGMFDESAPGEYVVSASYEGITSDTVTVTVRGAIFEVTDLRTDPEECTVGEDIELMIDVRNVGNEIGEFTVEFYLNGAKVGEDTVQVGAGGTETASVTYDINEAGDHTLEVEDESLTVTVEEKQQDGGDDGEETNYLLWIIIMLIIVLMVFLLLVVMRREGRI